MLLLYVTHILHYSDSKAYALWGTYVALGYITPVIGGWLVDRGLSFKLALIVGLLCMIGGNSVLMWMHPQGFYFGLALTLCGIGLFKGNISTLVGRLYPSGDTQRDQGYARFFMGIILGATLGPLVLGFLAMYVGWPMVFLVSAGGQLLALALFWHYRACWEVIRENKNMDLWFFVTAVSLLTILLGILLAYPVHSNNLLGLSALAVFLVMTGWIVNQCRVQIKKIVGLTLISLLLIAYYAASMQVSGSLVMAIERYFPVYIGHWLLSPTAFAALEAGCAFLFIPLFARLWNYMAAHNHAPSLFFKMGLGHVLAAASFAIFSWVFFTKSALLLGLIIANVLLGMSVVCVFPTHLSLISQYAPVAIQGTLMGMSFLPDALAGYVASVVTQLPVTYTLGGALYTHIYLNIAAVIFVIGMIIFLLAPLWGLLFHERNNLAFIGS